MPKPATRPGPKPGSQTALRQRNAQLIVGELARRGPTTQATLSRVIGLSTGTVSNIVKMLEGDHVVKATPTIESGRRALAISLVAGGRFVAGIAIERNRIDVVVAHYDQTVVAEVTTDNDQHRSALETLRRAKSLLVEALDDAALPREGLDAVGISIASVVTLDSTVVAPDPLLPHWGGVTIADLATDLFGVPCFVDNDANASAQAQVTFGPFKDTHDLAFIKLSFGIGAGLIMGDQLVRGSFGLAGELGHVIGNPQGELCRCGNRGCLETVASTVRIAEQLRRATRSREALDNAAVIRLARERDPAALRVLGDAGAAVGRAIAELCLILNPAVVVIGGELTAAGAVMIDPIYRAFHRHSLPELARRTALSANQLGPRTEALGAVALAVTSSSTFALSGR